MGILSLNALILWPATNLTHSSISKKIGLLLSDASSLRLEGRFRNSIEKNNEILRLLERTPDEKTELRCYKELGLLYWNIGNLSDSERSFKRALILAEKLADQTSSFFISNSIRIYDYYQEGKKLRAENNYKGSIEFFNKAISLSNNIGSIEHLIKCQRLLSLVYWDMGNFLEFYNLNITALELAYKIKNKREESNCLNNIGIYFIRTEDYSKSIEHCQQAYDIATEIGDLQAETDSLSNLGVVYQELGDYDRALECVTKSLAIDNKLSDMAQISIDYINRGTILRKRGLSNNSRDDLNDALVSFFSCLDLAKRAGEVSIEAAVFNNIGSIYSDQERYQKAIEYFRQAYDLANKTQDTEKKSRILNNLGIVNFKLGNLDESSQFYQQAINLAVANHDGQILWEVLLESANTYAKQKKYKDALISYKNSISMIENIRSTINLEDLKASYLGTDKRIEAYQNLIDLLVKLQQSDPDKGYDRQAFDYLERAKARAFLDSLEVSRVDISQGIDPLLANREKELMRDLSRAYHKLLAYDLPAKDKDELSEQIKSLEDQLESLKREIRMSSPAYADLKYPEVITYDEARKELLNPGDAYLAYSIAKEASYAFVISSNGLKIFSLPKKENLQKQVVEYRMAISDRQNKDFHLGRELFLELVAPGLEPGLKRLIVVPDDVLNFLPFETLLTKNDSNSWLVQDYMISYVPSLSSLRVLKQRDHSRPRPHKDLLAVGDATYRTNDERYGGGPSSGIVIDLGSTASVTLSPLKYSALEIQNISQLFNPGKVTMLEKEDASKRWLGSHDLTDYHIIHFATHSLIDDQKPARSAIVLSFNPDRADDGLLQARDIYNLRMNADLVTLSACQTGLGQFIRSEGIEGLSRAFFYAGTSSILMSLWSVNDQATCQLMERFYRHLRGGESLTGALREAKLEMIHSTVLSHLSAGMQ